VPISAFNIQLRLRSQDATVLHIRQQLAQLIGQFGTSSKTLIDTLNSYKNPWSQQNHNTARFEPQGRMGKGQHKLEGLVLREPSSVYQHEKVDVNPKMREDEMMNQKS